MQKLILAAALALVLPALFAGPAEAAGRTRNVPPHLRTATYKVVPHKAKPGRRMAHRHSHNLMRGS